MKNKCTQFTKEHISQFVDKELSFDLYQTIDDHQKECLYCKDLIKAYQTMSTLFSDHADREISKIDSKRLKESLKPVFTQKSENPLKSFRIGFGKNIYLKLASIVAILVISLVAFQGRLSRPTGPNAIVISGDTDFKSVIIIETEKQKHTIIWFPET